MLDVTALGELLIDFTCLNTDDHGYPTMAAHPGGAPANFLAALTNCGGSAALLGKVGRDAFGELLIRTLTDHHIDTRGVICDPEVFTTLAFVTLDAMGDRTFSFARKPGADTCLTAEELDLNLIAQAKVFHFGSLSLTSEPSATATRKAVEYARQAGKLISFDPNLRLPLWNSAQEARRQILWSMEQADVVKLSDEEGSFLFEASPEGCALRLMEDYGVKLVYVTCGKEGCFFANRNAQGWVPVPEGIEAVDTTGAGDIFGGSAMWKLLQTGCSPEDLTQEQLTDIVRFANTAAALSTTAPGGLSSIPSFFEIQKILSA